MRLKLVFILLLVTTLGFGLWPLRFSEDNRISFDSGERALTFSKTDSEYGGMLFSNELLDASEWNAISFVVELKGRPSDNGLGMILEVYDDSSPEHSSIKIAQWRDHLAIRSGRSRDTVRRGYSEIGYRDCIFDTDYTRILISSDSRGTTVVCGDMKPQFNEGFRLLDSVRMFRGRLIIGNGPSGEQPLWGAIRRFDLFDTALPVDFLDRQDFPQAVVSLDLDHLEDTDTRLLVSGGSSYSFVAPDRLRALKREFFAVLSLVRWRESGFQRDFFLNLFGFIPLGLCLSRILSFEGNRFAFNASIKVILLCLLTSFAIESAQGFLLGRHSSQLDLLLNGVSGVLSVFVFRFLPDQFWKKAKL